MQYVITFLEGIITFISPCLLPMIPIYAGYFAGGGERKSRQTLKCALGFVLGFTMVFLAMGALAGTVGRFLMYFSRILSVICGLVVIFFGLVYLGVIRLNLFKGREGSLKTGELGFFSSVLFGMTFSIGWTPCVGTFLGSALMMASSEGTVLKGVLLLFCYSAGLGVPFVISALLIDRLKGAFGVIKRHYDVINKVCGVFLIIVGLLMATGMIGRLLSILTVVKP